MEGLDTLIMRKKQSSKSSSLESNGSSSNQTSPASQWFSSKSSKKELTLDLNQPTDLLLLCLGKKVCGMHMSLENLFCFRTWI
ncbi:hypothetical protein V6Z12_D13G177700 [Gossypium hirsutum]